jgi:hypothetical protein
MYKCTRVRVCEHRLRYLREYSNEIAEKTAAFGAAKEKFDAFLQLNVDKLIKSFKRFLREDADTKKEYEVRP